MKKRTVYFILTVFLCYCFYCLFLNQKSLNKQIQAQIEYIACNLSEDHDVLLNNKYPEGYLFANSIFAMSLIEYCASNKEAVSKYQFYIESAIDKLLSDYAKSNFDKTRSVPYGCFYTAWTNLALKAYLESELYLDSEKFGLYQKHHLALDSMIISAFEHRGGFHESYVQGIWPADNLACLASIDKKNAKRIFTSLWQTKSEEIRLLPHDLTNDTLVRGSSSALSLYFLSQFMDQEYIANYNAAYKSKFEKRIFGLNLINEYESSSSDMDYDSGPIVMGIGSVASIMNVKTQSITESPNSAKSTWAFLNLIGLPLKWKGQKFYLAKQELIFDVFMLWTGISFLD